MVAARNYENIKLLQLFLHQAVSQNHKRNESNELYCPPGKGFLPWGEEKVESRRGEIMWFSYTNYKSLYRSQSKTKEPGNTLNCKLKAIYFLYNQGHFLVLCKTTQNFFPKGYSKVKLV